MPEINENPPATVPAQREAVGPVKKSTPVVIALVAIVALIGIANVSSLVSGKKRSAPPSALPMRPSTANPQQVASFETQQQMQARRDAEDQQRQHALAAEMQQLQQEQAVPGPEADGTPRMTAAQRDAIYGDSPNAPQQTSNVSQAQAEAKQKALEREKLHQDALNSDTVAIDFSHQSAAPPAASPASTVLAEREEAPTSASAETANLNAPDAGKLADTRQTKPAAKVDPMAPYDFDNYQGRLYRIFEGTVLEGVVTNHIDGGLAGPILIKLKTDDY